MLSRLRVAAVRAWSDMRAAKLLSLLTAGTVAAALVVFGAFLMGLHNLEGLARVWGRAATVAVVLDETTQPSEREALRQALAALAQVETATVVLPGEALARFRARGPHEAELVDGVAEDILPASIELTLRADFADFADVAAIGRLAETIETRPHVAEVDYGREEFAALALLLRLLRYGGIALAVVMLLATAFIVANTIRLTVYARRDEISILRLVGATAWFVNIPFVVEGTCWGACGGLGAAAVFGAAEVFLAPRVTAAASLLTGGLDIHFVTPQLLPILLLIGGVLGLVGSLLAVRRFGDVESD